MRLLLVEDHVPLADELVAGLSRQGYAVDWLADGRDAVYQGASEPYDLIILDLGLPGKPGLEVLREWRAGGLATPVLILTARGSWAERIDGLKAGADDYLTKPFHPEELALRIQALLRRAHGLANQPQLEAAGLQLDESRQCVCRDGKEVELTSAEFRLLRYFIRGRSSPRASWPSTCTTERQSVIPTCWKSTSIACAVSSAGR
jgi:DNA-binding response OmpR family regulator